MDNILNVKDTDGLYIPDFNVIFEEASKDYTDALNDCTEAMIATDKARCIMEVAGLQIETQLIEQHNGNAKKIGATETDRKRAFDMAKNTSTAYTEAQGYYYGAKSQFRYHQGMVRLHELRLQFLIATAKK